jgi:hypothetical protein
VSSAPSVPGDTRPGAEKPAAEEPAGPALAGPVLSGLALARGEVDRSAHLRTDANWLRAAWADQRTRVIVAEGGQALCELDRGEARIAFAAPAEAPAGVQFLPELTTAASPTSVWRAHCQRQPALVYARPTFAKRGRCYRIATQGC